MNEIVETIEAVTYTHLHLYKQENSGLKYTLVFNLIKHARQTAEAKNDYIEEKVID